MRLPRATRALAAALTVLSGVIVAPSLGAQSLPRPVPGPGPVQRVAPRLDLVPYRGLRAVAARTVVRYEPGTTLQERAALHADLGARLVRSLGPDMAVLELPDDGPLEALLVRVGTRARIRYAEPDVMLSAVSVLPAAAPALIGPGDAPNDPSSTLQWALGRVRAQQAWEQVQGDPGVVVAILDTGVLTSHPDLAGNVAWGLDLFDDDEDPTDTHGHGTHCAGLAAAVTDNGLGISGMGYDCRYAAYRCGDGNLLPSSMVIAGILDAVDRGAQVLSMSFGIYLDLQSLDDALQDAVDAGCVLVAAAGNDAQDVPFYPAAYPQVIGVAASAPNDSRAIFSNYGDWVSVAAPGQSMYSTVLGDGYGYMSGTSMACPLVAGMAALLYAQGGGTRSPALAASVRSALEQTAVPVSGSWVSSGRTDLAAAVDAMDSGSVPVLETLSPDSAHALGGGVATASGTGFLGTTGALLGSLPVPVTVVDDTTLTFPIPVAPALGDLPFVIQKGSATSNALMFHRSAVNPPLLQVASETAVGKTVVWTFGSAPGDVWILLASLSPTTASLQGWNLLSPFVVGPVGSVDEQGLGSWSAVIPASAAGITLHTQVISGPGYLTGATAVSATTVAP